MKKYSKGILPYLSHRREINKCIDAVPKYANE